MTLYDKAQLIAELAGGVCRCGSAKEPGRTFCRPCFYSLPVEQRKALYRVGGYSSSSVRRLGDGYEKAYSDAEATLLERRRIRA